MALSYIKDSHDLTEKNFLLYAAKHYENPHCNDMDEFLQDLLIPLHLKKLFTRYQVNGILKDRLILNHVISFFNVFSPFAACKILFYKIDTKYYSYLKTILLYLNRCPDYITINGNTINLNIIPTDEVLLNLLETQQKNGYSSTSNI
jgi:hypothetical protein